MVAMIAALAGCETKSFFDPSEVGRYKKGEPLVIPILDVINPAIEGPDSSFATAVDVQPEDLKVVTEDYVVGPNDLLTVSITDLIALNVETVRQPRVSESGNITLPLIGQIRASGLSEAEVQQAVANAYREGGYIEDPQVSVFVSEARARTFSILGSVGAPNQYPILKSDFRLLDALVLSRDVTSPFIENIYVIRPIKAEQKPAAAPVPAQEETVDPLAPAGEEAAAPQPDQPVAEEFEFAAPSATGESKIIRVPLDPLRNGELRYNIVVRPDDLIFVPTPVIGEYFLGGHIARPGVYSLTGRNITLKQAITAAAGLDALAIPRRTEIIRRIGDNQEMIVRIDLDAIFSGNQPDIFLKPDDTVRVGTNAIAPFLASARNAFRMTYGFGFLYDRNFAAEENNRGRR